MRPRLSPLQKGNVGILIPHILPRLVGSNHLPHWVRSQYCTGTDMHCTCHGLQVPGDSPGRRATRSVQVCEPRVYLQLTSARTKGTDNWGRNDDDSLRNETPCSSHWKFAHRPSHSIKNIKGRISDTILRVMTIVIIELTELWDALSMETINNHIQWDVA